jgi:tRNA wybutosine-synthesizing protein 2
MKRNCIATDKLSAAAVIKYVRYNGLLDTNYRIEQVGNMVYIPLTKPIDGSTIHNFESRMPILNKGKTPDKRIKKRGFSYVILGNSMILKGNPGIKAINKYAKILPIDNIYLETGKIQGVKRKPSLKLIYGKGGETKIKESGITYIMDLQKVMFSPGNINTRSKMKYMDFTGMVVIDMFCGIGYFSLQVLKNSRPAKMIMCDINQDSIYYLKRNLAANRIESQAEIYTGDSRTVLPDIFADYIIMGNFNSIKFLCHALIRSHEGTKISMHYLAAPEKVNGTISRIIKMAREFGYILVCSRSYTVKSVGPNYLHINSIFNIIQKI